MHSVGNIGHEIQIQPGGSLSLGLSEAYLLSVSSGMNVPEI